MAEAGNDAAGPQDIEADKTGSVGFAFTSFRDFLKFTEYVGETIPVEFAEPVLDSAGTVLIQKSGHLRPGVIKNLWKFFNVGNLNEKITISETKTLREAIREKICRSLCKCLEPGRFNLAQALSDASKVNIRTMLGNIVQRRDMLPIFLRLDQQEDPLLPHLGEVALVAAGFVEQYFELPGGGGQGREAIRIAMIAGLLHDIALADDADFLSKDIEKATESQHAAKGAQIVKTLLPDIDPVIIEIIRQHHRMDNPYKPDLLPELNATGVALEAVALSEFIFLQLRSQYKTDETMSSPELLFYDLGRAFGRGKFHPHFRNIAAKLWESLYATLQYGLEIGMVENLCPYKPSAIAYPSPRCTQVMCHADVKSCENYDPHFPLEVLQPMRFPGKPGVLIQPGKYAKCKMAQYLPKELSAAKAAKTWMERGKSTDS